MAKKRKKSKKKKSIKKPAKEQSPKVTPYPTAGQKVKEFEDKLDEQLAGGAAKKPAEQKSQAGPELPPELDIEIVAGVIKLPFELWAISQNIKLLSLSDKEAQRLAKPVKQLLDYYMPQIPVIAYAWVSLAIDGFWIMRTRLLLIAEYKKSSPSNAATRKGPGLARPAPAGQQNKGDKFPTEIKTQKI